MEIHLEQIKVNEKNSGFVDSGFVKICDELIKGQNPIGSAKFALPSQLPLLMY